jgi:fructose-1,6-bisphosphatase/inositol monophosphatase family enzyme
MLKSTGKTVGLCAHPYDLCTYLIATEAGAVVTDASGGPLSYALTTDVDCEWIGYANESILAEMRPALSAVLRDLADKR